MIARGPGITACLLCLALPLAAEPGPCAPREVVVARLQEVYGETRRSVERTAGRATLELFASDATGSWTMTATRPGGLTCLIASGRDYEALAREARAPGRDT